jgi:hypothetical protein
MRWVLILLVIAGCGEAKRAVEEQAPIPAPPADAIVKESPQGPAVITVRVWPAQPTLGDSIWLQLEAKAEDGVTVEMPFDQQALGRFAVLRYAQDVGKDTYELAAPMSGKQRIPPLRVVVHDARNGASVDTEVLTEEIPIDVGTVLSSKTDATLAPARGAIATEVGGRALWPFLVAAIAALLIAIGVVLWIVLRDRAVRRGRISAWELAMRRLADLEARGAPGGEDADGWFVELSAVVRAYVEGRYRLRAPELTTEEFLLEARRIPDLGDGHRDLLGSFLERCDRVKFAGWRPEADESLTVLGSARDFVQDSRPPAASEASERAVSVQAVPAFFAADRRSKQAERPKDVGL